MFYFIIQTMLLALLVFVVGLFIGIFLKNMWCKKKHLQALLSHEKLRQKGRSYRSGNKRQHNSTYTNANTSTVYRYNVDRSESAALAKKRTAALIGQRNNNRSVRPL